MAKFKNKKLIAMVTTAFAGVAIIGTGFAGWVITQSADGTVTGGITADGDVQTNAFSLEAGAENDGQNIVFAPTAASSTGWLHTTVNNGAENLDATFTWTMTYSTTTKNATVYFNSLVFGVTGTNSANYATLVSEGIVGALPTYAASAPASPTAGYFTVSCTNATGSDATVGAFARTGSSDNYTLALTNSTEKSVYVNKVTITIGVHFVWGSAFGYGNPAAYYNNQSFTAALAAEAAGKIDRLDLLASNVGYSLSFTVAPSAA